MAVVAVLVAVSLLVGALILLISAALVGPRPEAVGSGAVQEESNNVGNGVTEKQTTSKKQKVQRFRKERLQQHVFSHPVLAATLKGHSGNISCLDFSSNSKYLASCSDDRTVRIWSTKDFLERDHRCMRANVDLDHATHVRFSPDSRAFITWLANEETVRVFKMTKKDDGSLTFSASVDDFPKKHRFPIVNISIAETGKFIMSAASDTTILIWDLKGEVMATINTNQMNNAFATVSPCGRFVASCGFTPDVKVWEVCFTKSGEFQEVLRAFDLKGHSAGVYSFAFSNDSRRMATVSKDGTWKLWDTDVEYKKQQDPYLLLTIKCDVADPCRIALSPDARVVAISSGFNISVYNAKTGEKEEEFLNVHGEEIVELAFDVNSRFLVSSGDRAIRVFHNVVGYRAVITEMEAMLKRPTSEAMRERLQRQISNAQSALDSVCIKQQQWPQTL